MSLERVTSLCSQGPNAWAGLGRARKGPAAPRAPVLTDTHTGPESCAGQRRCWGVPSPQPRSHTHSYFLHSRLLSCMGVGPKELT